MHGDLDAESAMPTWLAVGRVSGVLVSGRLLYRHQTRYACAGAVDWQRYRECVSRNKRLLTVLMCSGGDPDPCIAVGQHVRAGTIGNILSKF
jgi:hypothetical protein